MKDNTSLGGSFELHPFVIPIPRNPPNEIQEPHIHGIPPTDDTPRRLCILGFVMLLEKETQKEKGFQFSPKTNEHNSMILIFHGDTCLVEVRSNEAQFNETVFFFAYANVPAWWGKQWEIHLYLHVCQETSTLPILIRYG